MSITERLANLSIPAVLIICAALLAIRFALRKQPSQIAKTVGETAESLAIAMALVFLIIRPFIVQAFFIPSESMLPGLRIDDHILVNKFIYRFIREPRLGDVVVFKAPIDAIDEVSVMVNEEADKRGLEGEERERFVEKRGRQKAKDFIKRVIGVPGDVVRITVGHVQIGDMDYEHGDLRQMLREYGRSANVPDVKLTTSGKVLVDGRLVTDAEIAAAAGVPGAKVKVSPGNVIVNGKVLNEPYTAEDSAKEYPITGLTPEEWIVKDKDGHDAVKIPEGRLLVMGDNRNASNDSRFWKSGLLERDRVLGKAMFIFWPLNRIRWVH